MIPTEAEFLGVLRKVIAALDAVGIEYALGGSFAVPWTMRAGRPKGGRLGWTNLPRTTAISRNPEQQDNETNNPADVETQA